MDNYNQEACRKVVERTTVDAVQNFEEFMKTSKKTLKQECQSL